MTATRFATGSTTSSTVFNSVLDYGAIGDGTTDDTLAIQAAINASKNGGTVYFPQTSADTYKTTGVLNCENCNGLELLGAGGRKQFSTGPTIKFAGSNTALGTLTADITTTIATTISVSAAAPAVLGSGQFDILIGTEKLFVVSGATTTTWTVRRGWQNTTAATHLSGASIVPAFPAISARTVAGFTMQNLRVQYTDATFDRVLLDIDWSTAASDPTNWRISDCAFRGNNSPTASNATSLIRANHAIIGIIEGCHFGEVNGPSIKLGDGNYAVGIEVRGNTFNSGAAGTYAVETNAGSESILIEGNVFEPRAGTYPGSWRQTGTTWHVTFRDNWQGDIGSNLYPYISIEGSLFSGDISSNRFFATPAAILKVTGAGTLLGTVITGNFFDSPNLIDLNPPTSHSVWIFGNYPQPIISGTYKATMLESSAGIVFQPNNSNPNIGISNPSPMYALDVAPSLQHGARLVSGSLYFGGSNAAQDATKHLGPANLIGLEIGPGEQAAGSQSTGLVLRKSANVPTKAQVGSDGGAIIAFDSGDGTTRLRVSDNACDSGFMGRYLTSTTTWDPPSVAAAGQTTTTITVSGAALGDVVGASFSLDLQAMQLTGHVSSANTVTVVLRNGTAGAIDLASGTLKAAILK